MILVYLTLGILVLCLVARAMAKAGSPFFKIGYYLYSKTPVGHIYYRREVAKAAQKYNSLPHSQAVPAVYNGLKITPVALSMDNYSYIITDQNTKISVMVDPADPAPIQEILDRDGLTPSAVLTTHKHWDHSDGNTDWKKRYRGIQIYGGAMDQVPGATHTVSDGDQLQMGELRFTVHFTPGHTVGHVVYVLDGAVFSAPPMLFSGDLLFLGGIGRMFECNPSTMLASLDKVCSLPDDTLLWPGHEYAVDNLEFGATIEPQNHALLEKYEYSKEKRKERKITSPSTLLEEKQYNVFLRTSVAAVQEAVGLMNTEQADLRPHVLAALRARKDKFKYKL